MVEGVTQWIGKRIIEHDSIVPGRVTAIDRIVADN